MKAFTPSEAPYLLLDARYERVRECGQVVDCAVLVTVGVTASGHWRVLGVSVGLSEAGVHWRAFLDCLIQRGLRGVKFISSDVHDWRKAARKTMFAGLPWQRCQFHLQHNAQGYGSKLDQRVPVSRTIRSIFNASDANEATWLLGLAMAGRRSTHPKLAAWAETNLVEGFSDQGEQLELGDFPQLNGCELDLADNHDGSIFDAWHGFMRCRAVILHPLKDESRGAQGGLGGGVPLSRETIFMGPQSIIQQ